MRRRGLNLRKWFLRVILPGLRLLPGRAASLCVARIGQVEYDWLKTLRLRYDRAVERSGHHLGCRWHVPAIARDLAGNHIRWRTRDLLLDGLSDQHVAPLFNVLGRAILDEALARKQGVILLGNHFGANLMPAHWLLREQYPLRLYMERPRHVSRYLNQKFETDGPMGQRELFISRKSDPAEAARSILRAARVLKSGMLVKLACDVRWTGAHTASATFLGRTYSFSTTWITLASMTQAPVVPVFCRMAEDGSYELEFLDAFQIPSNVGRGDDLAPWVRTSLDVIAERVRNDPTNSNDYFFWADDAEAAELAGAPSIAR